MNETLELARGDSDAADVGSILMPLAIVARRRGRLALAVEFLENTLKIAQQSGNKTLEGKALHNLGNVFGNAGRFAEAEDVLRKALALNQDRESAKFTISASLAEICFQTSRPEIAEPLILGAIEFARRAGMRRVLAFRLLMLAQGLASIGRREEAVKLQHEASATAAELLDERLAAQCAAVLTELSAPG